MRISLQFNYNEYNLQSSPTEIREFFLSHRLSAIPIKEFEEITQ